MTKVPICDECKKEIALFAKYAKHTDGTTLCEECFNKLKKRYHRMKKVNFAYLEVLNETEQLMIFTVRFNKRLWGVDIILNTALPVTIQDIQLRKTIAKAEGMNIDSVVHRKQ